MSAPVIASLVIRADGDMEFHASAALDHSIAAEALRQVADSLERAAGALNSARCQFGANTDNPCTETDVQDIDNGVPLCRAHYLQAAR